MSTRAALAAVVAAFDEPHHGDMDAARDALYAPIEAARLALAAPPSPRLFSWWSECLKQYAEGRVCAVAETEDEARELIRAALLPWLREDREYEFRPGPDGEPADEDAAEWVAKCRALLEKDLEAAPEVGATLFIRGSE